MKAIIVLFKSDGSSDRGFPVKVIVSHKNRKRRKTIAHSELKDWDVVLQVPKKTHPDFEDLYSYIMNIRIRAQKSDFLKLENIKSAMDLLLKTGRVAPARMDFYNYAEKRIAQLEEAGRKGNARVYRVAVESLRQFSPVLEFENFTHNKIDQYRARLEFYRLKNSTIRNYISTIRAIYNSAVRDEVAKDQQPFRSVMRKVPVRTRRANNKYLDYPDIRKLEVAELPPAMRRSADICLLQFYFCGLDLIDVYHLKAGQFYNGRVFLKRMKLGVRAYEFDVKIIETAQIIIDRYYDPVVLGGEKYVFPWIRTRGTYETFRSNHQRNLNKLKKRLDLKLLPRGGSFSTKVMRHTFATLGKFAWVEEDLLRELMGHERNEIDTIYKDKYPEAERDAAQEKVIFGG